MNAPAVVAAGLAAAAGTQCMGASRSARAPHHTARAPDTSPPTDWATFLDSFAAGVRAGHTLREAFGIARPFMPANGSAVTAEVDLRDVPTLTCTDPDEAVVVQSISVALSLGGPSAIVLQSAAVLLRERAHARADALAHAAQARLSARVLTSVPLVFCAWGVIASPSFRDAISQPFGVAAAAGGVLLNVAGWWWMRRIVGRVTA